MHFLCEDNYVCVYCNADCQSSKSETPFTADGPDSKLNFSKIERPSPQQVQLPSASSDAPQPPKTEDSCFRRIGGLFGLGLICLPGT